MNGAEGMATPDATHRLGVPASVRSGSACAFLAGRSVLVTRPAQQAVSLAEAIVSAGGAVWLLPTLEISALGHSPVLDACVRRLGDYDLVIFVSANAVWATLARARLLGLDASAAIRRAAAPGPATAAALTQAGVTEVVLPHTRFDSTGLIEALAACRTAPTRALVLRGAGVSDDVADEGSGREELLHWLRGRGATVESVACYRRTRVAPDPGRLAALLSGLAPDAAIVTSTEGGQSLLALLGAPGSAWLAAVPMFVPHRRIAASMTAAGMRAVHVTAGGDGGLMRGLAEWFGGAAA